MMRLAWGSMYLHAPSDEYFLIFRHMGQSQSVRTQQKRRETKVKKSQTGICEMSTSRYVINLSIVACSECDTNITVSSRSRSEVARFISGRAPGNAGIVMWGSSFACYHLVNAAQGWSHYEKGMYSIKLLVITGAPGLANQFYRSHVLQLSVLLRNAASTSQELANMSLNSSYLLMKALLIVGQHTVDVHGRFEEPKHNVRHFLYEAVGKCFCFSACGKIITNAIKATRFFLRYLYVMVSCIATL